MCEENPQDRDLTIEKVIEMSVYFVEEKRKSKRSLASPERQRLARLLRERGEIVFKGELFTTQTLLR